MTEHLLTRMEPCLGMPMSRGIRLFQEIKRLVPASYILYGGSANEENIDQLKQIPSINGYLLGGLSLKVDKLKVFIEKLH